MIQPAITKVLFFDIETVGITKDFLELEEKYPSLTKQFHNYFDWFLKRFPEDQGLTPAEVFVNRAALVPEFSKIVCASFAFVGPDGKTHSQTFSGDNEKEVLLEFSQLLSQHFNTTSHFLCAHNGKEFDFPFLCRRLLVNKIPLPKLLQIQGFKPWEVKHLDTMEMWRFGDIKNFTSLNLLANIFNVPSPKDDIDGSQIAKVFYEDKNIERIKTYCLKDVITLARIYQCLKGLEPLNDDDIIYT